MGTRIAFLAIAMSLLVAACTTMQAGGGKFMGPHKEDAKECNGNGTCMVEVSVSGGDINVSPPFVVVNNKRHEINIFFKAIGGITIENIDFGVSEFDCTAPTGSDPWKCRDKHTDFGVYKYTVKVKDVGVKDPWIVND